MSIISKAISSVTNQNQPSTQSAKDDPIQKASLMARTMIADGKTKVETARAIYPFIESQTKEVVLKVFIESIGLTERGAVTYLYNLKRDAKMSGAEAINSDPII
jgi:hypothetical protein